MKLKDLLEILSNVSPESLEYEVLIRDEATWYPLESNDIEFSHAKKKILLG